MIISISYNIYPIWILGDVGLWLSDELDFAIKIENILELRKAVILPILYSK